MNAKICLNMIVKNESKTLPNLFETLKDVIDYYVILDTGSTDNTPDLIKNLMDEYRIEGEVHHTQWINFGVCREKALRLADGKAEYVLIIDADEKLICCDNNFMKNLTKDCYYVMRKYSRIEYYLPALINIKNNIWHWNGVVHNYLSCENKIYSKENIDPEILYIYSKFHGGAKSHGVSPKEKYLRDAGLLKEELKKNPNDSRSQFYLAQSYHDAGFQEKAIKHYKRRIEMGGWKEEIYYSKLRVGRLMICSGHNIEDAIPILLDAYQIMPSRIESIYTIVFNCRKKGLRHIGHLIGKAVVDKRSTEAILFVEKYVYDYALLDEYSICAYWAGDYEDCKRCCEILLKEDKIPENNKERIKKNLEFAENKIS